MKNDVKISPYGNMLIYKRGYSAKFVHDIIEEKGLLGLRIFDHLDKLDSLSFLSDFVFLKKLEIDCLHDQDYSFLKNLSALESLRIGPSTTKNNIIDLSSQVNLMSLSLHWRNERILSLGKCYNLISLSLENYTEKDFVPIASLINLQYLKVATASVRNCNGIENLIRLRSIFFGNCKKLSNIEALKKIKSLTTLEFELCPEILDYSYVGYLSNLLNLKIVNCKGIKSIEFIDNLPSLLYLSLLGNTNILDGNLEPAKRIKEVFYKHRAHYNTRINNENYDKLLKSNLEKIKKML